jgi:hypothetical protein
MANAFIWFTPTSENGARTVEIDLGAPFTNREGPHPVCFQSSAEGTNGYRVQTWNGGRNRTRFIRTWDSRAAGDGYLIRRQIWALQNHLARNGTCQVAEDKSFAFAAFASPIPAFNATTVLLGRNKFYPNISTGLTTNITGREVMLQTDCDAYISEMKLVSAWTSQLGGNSKLTLNGGLIFDYPSEARWVLVREYGSYLSQRLPSDVDPDSILTHDHENNWTLDLTLEDDPEHLDTRANADTDGDGGPISGGIDSTGGINPDWDSSGSILHDTSPSYLPNKGGWWIP